MGDNKTKDTAAIRAACAALEKAGGGTLLFPRGKVYLTGALNLSSNTLLKLEAGAVIRGTGDTSGGDYPLLTLSKFWRWFGETRTLPGCSGATQFMYSPTIFAHNQRNISIVAEEGGTLDGYGLPWWACERNYSLAPCSCHARPHNLLFSNVSGVSLGSRFRGRK